MSDWLANPLDSHHSVLICDGAMGTELQRRLGQPRSLPDPSQAFFPAGLTLERPELVLAVHRAYRDAGAECLLTNTFGANCLNPALSRSSVLAGAINETAARLARVAAGPKGLVWGDVGPTSWSFSRPCGEGGAESEAEVEAAFFEQVAALLRGGVDAILIETMGSLHEAEVALQAARRATTLPILVSMCYRSDSSGCTYRTLAGEDLSSVARALARAGASALGSNCSDLGETLALVRELRAVSALPILARPSAGLPRTENGRIVYPDGPAEFARGLAELRAAGALLVGGCCGTTPEHIRVWTRS